MTTIATIVAIAKGLADLVMFVRERKAKAARKAAKAKACAPRARGLQ